MESAYQRGVFIVLVTVLTSGIVCLASFRPSSYDAPAAQDLGEAASRIGPFQFTERSGTEITDATLADKVWIGSFIFTRCSLSCPRITSIMKSLQSRLAGDDVKLVSISVDPEHDTPAVLNEYAKRFDADPDRWWFLTGPRDAIYEMINQKFYLTAMTNPAPDPEGRDEAVIHSDRLALVDRGVVVGLFDTSDASALESLVAQARRRASPQWVRTLPAINASLNGLCTLLLITGWIMIWRFPRGTPRESLAAPAKQSSSSLIATLLRNPRTRGHVIAMGLAVFTSICFLGFYLLYHSIAGSVAFRGRGGVRWLYLTILLSHTLLATFGVAPLVVVTLFRALRGEFSRHAQIARLTLPIWLYVSITGVVIYLMLYHMPVSNLAVRAVTS